LAINPSLAGFSSSRNYLKNPNIETRNPKQYRNPKFKCSKLLNLDHLVFEFVSGLDIRISNLLGANKASSSFLKTVHGKIYKLTFN